MRTLFAAAVVCLSLAFSGCAKLHYTPHPGSINVEDSSIYDLLVDTRAGLDQAYTQINTGKLPKDAIHPYNVAAASYNTAKDLYDTYHMSQDGTLLPKLREQVGRMLADMAVLHKVVAPQPAPAPKVSLTIVPLTSAAAIKEGL